MIKDIFRDLLVAKWGAKKGAPNLARIPYHFPYAYELQYKKLAEKYMAYVLKPAKIPRPVYERWLREAQMDTQTDGFGYDLAALNQEMLERQKFVFEGTGTKANPGLVPSVLSIGEGVDDLSRMDMDRLIKITIGQAFDIQEPWVAELLKDWANTNYNLIKTLSDTYIAKVSSIASDAVAYGMSYKDLTEKLMVATGHAYNHAKLIARDQIGKLNGRLTKGRQEQLGISMYTWRTAADERVRGRPKPVGKYPKAKPSHWVMENLLCKWADPAVYSEDGGETWIPRPASAPTAHPGQEIQCRCQGIPNVDDILAEGRNLLGLSE